MGIFVRACLFLFLFECFNSNAQQAQDAAWCGNKHKNLVILRDIVQGMPGVEVPAFLGISTDRVEKFLEEHASSIFTDYVYALEQIVTEEVDPAQRRQIQSLVNQMRKRGKLARLPFVGPLLQRMAYHVKSFLKKQLHYEAVLRQVQDRIKNCFDDHVFPFTAKEERFIAGVAQQGKFFMVRSTGIEDSQTVANAGGNVSVAYVNPAVRYISHAMGEVVASYFGERSMKNRLLGGESLEFCLPVLIQELIGEPQGGAAQAADIPVSGVAFTTRAGLSSKNFSLMEIGAAYGHGEGVVAGSVSADRYYVTASRVRSGDISVYPAIRKKLDRLVSDSQRSARLRRQANSNEYVLRSALSKDQLRQMHRAFKHIEVSYGQPMDIEFVIQGNTLFIVQARPAMRSAMRPSYCRHEQLTTDQCTVMKGSTLVLGSAEAVVIERAEDLVVMETLDMADGLRCKAVIVKEWAPSLSHAAVNFTSRGIPCLLISDREAVIRLKRSISPETPLIVDSQRGCIIALHSNGQNELQPGWFEHPAEGVLSIASAEPCIAHTYITPIPQDGKLVALLEQFKCEQDSNVQRQLLAQIVERISARCQLTEHRMKFLNVVHEKTLHINFACFRNTLQQIVDELGVALDRNADRFEILFYHKMLEALVYQPSDQLNIVNAFTYSYFLNELFVRQNIYRIIAQHGSAAIYMKELGYASLCPDRNLALQWTTCIQELLRPGIYQQEQTIALKTLLADVHEMGSLSLWFATEFYKLVRSCSTQSSTEVAHAVSEYAVKELQYIDLLQQCKRIKSLLEALKEACSRPYATRAVAQSVWWQIESELISFIANEELLRTIKGASSTVQLIACDLFVQIIDVIDTAMKTLKTSTAISLNDRIDQFKTMLRGFHRVCDAVMNAVWDGRDGVTEYLFDIRRLLNRIIESSKDEVMFQRSTAFSVQAALFTSRTTFSRHHPQTAEDMFMLLHQNSLCAVAQWNSQLLPKPLHESIMLPQQLYEIVAFLRSDVEAILKKYNHEDGSDGNVGMPGQTGLRYTNDDVTIFYNMPLRNHSSTFQIVYDTIQQQCRIDVQFLGPSRDRWEQVALLAELSEGLSGINLHSSVVFDEPAGIVSWSWIITPEVLPIVFEYLGTMGLLSLIRDDNNNITLQTLRSLYKGLEQNELSIIRNVIENYERTKGSNQYMQHILKELENVR